MTFSTMKYWIFVLFSMLWGKIRAQSSAFFSYPCKKLCYTFWTDNLCIFALFQDFSHKNPTNQLFWLNFQCNVTTYTKVDEQKMEGGFQVLYKFRLLRLVQKKVQPHFFKMIRNFCVFLAFFALINQFLRQDIY